MLGSADEALISDPSGWSLGGNDIDLDRAEDRKIAVNFNATLDMSGSGPWEYLKAGVKFQRSDRSLFEANVLDADGDLFFEEDGFRGPDRSISAHPTIWYSAVLCSHRSRGRNSSSSPARPKSRSRTERQIFSWVIPR
jgi:hypothetical protein